MSVSDADGLPDMQALHKTNDLIPDPRKLKEKEIPAEDIAGWFLPFEITFGMVYWQTMGMFLLLAFVGTILFGWIIPMQQRYALLAKAEFMKERTQLGHLTWEEQCQIIRFEPILEPAFKMDEDGKPIKDLDDDLIPDELDLEDWITELDLEGRIIEHEDGMLSTIHTLNNRYIASVFQRWFEAKVQGQGNFETDKKGWILKTLKYYLPLLARGARKGAQDFGGWLNLHKARFGAAITLGFVIIMFGNWIWIGLSWLLNILGWNVG